MVCATTGGGATSRWAKQRCLHPPPASGLSPTAAEYRGTWYEIGKIQTAGGAFFESACVCTQLVVTPSTRRAAQSGDAAVLNSCRDKTPAGKFINATAQLVNMSPPGHWDETFVPNALGVFVNYTVIMQGTDPETKEQCVPTSRSFSRSPRGLTSCIRAARMLDTCLRGSLCVLLTIGGSRYSVEYDCADSILGPNYCIHILGRRPTMTPLLVGRLLNETLAMGLNTENLQFKHTRQADCW